MHFSERTPAETALVFARTPLARLVSCTAVFGSAALLFDYLARGPENIQLLPLLGLAILVAGTFVSALLQYGDFIYLGSEGVLYRNRWLPFLRRGEWIAWDEIVEVREIRRKILVLLGGDGKRMIVDAIADYAVARREILRHAPQAVISGTLQREDRPRPNRVF